jgi:hypothetical protein
MNTPVPSFEASEYDDDASVNPSTNAHLNEVMAARPLSRRQALQGGMSATAGVLLGGMGLPVVAADGAAQDAGSALLNDEARRKWPLRLGFKTVDKNRLDRVTVPAGYRVDVLHSLGDPLQWGDAAWQDNGSESAESYERRIGDGHDGMRYFGLGENGRYRAERSDRGLLCVNHEYVVGPYALHPNGRTIVDNVRTVPAEVDKEILAHGVSVVEVRRERHDKDPSMKMVRGSRFNRRITSATEMAFAGPVRGSALVATKFSPDGTRTLGTNNNCANGYTPWGTYLTCEENYLNVISRAAGDDVRRSAKEVIALNRYGLPENRRSPYLWDTAGAEDRYARWNSSVTAASATQDWRNTINTFGWVVEIDPFDPVSTPVKRSALGRFNHEGAWPAPAVAGEPIVIYMGDDARNEYIYKFVSKAAWDPRDAGRGLAAGAKYLDEGTLYVARFNADGTGEWMPLVHGKNGLDVNNPAFAFADQADVLVHARLAGDVLGATKMDRPEWGAVNPRNGEAYMTLTNNSNRVAPSATPTGSQLRPDAANPRYYEDTYTNPDGTTRVNKGNPNGHIIRWREAWNRNASRRFHWDVYLFAAQADAPADVNLSGLTAVNDFSSPDGLHFDERGLLWIQTDDGAYTDVTNCMMLAAVAGWVGDGGPALAAGGTATIKGVDASAHRLRRFLVGPVECEITGITLTPDGCTMFINIQHPGEDGALDAPTSHWPDSQTNASSTRRPRSSTVVITREDGGPVGLS